MPIVARNHIPCPQCDAAVGEFCRTSVGIQRKDHAIRTEVAKMFGTPGACPTAHLAPHILRALRAARIRPMRRQCFRNASRLVLHQQEVKLSYIEGIARSPTGLVLQHAWVRDADGVDHDVTLTNTTLVEAVAVVDRNSLCRLVAATRHWGPFEYERLDAAHRRIESPRVLPRLWG